MMNYHILLLNADYSPLNVVGFEQGFGYVVRGKAITVEPYKTLNTPRGAIELPLVVRLKKYVNVPSAYRSKWSRKGVIRRDNSKCVYCGVKVKDDGGEHANSATIDHIVARSVLLARGVTPNTWSNTVCACRKCNQAKGDRSLSETGMKFLDPNFEPKMPRDRWAIVAELYPAWSLYITGY